MTIDGATDTDVFRAYVAGVLCPTLRPGDLVVTVNLAPHKNEPTLALIAAAGAEVLFLPAYFPDFNPFEKTWSKVKALLRSTEARNSEDLVAPVGAALAQVTPKMPSAASGARDRRTTCRSGSGSSRASQWRA